MWLSKKSLETPGVRHGHPKILFLKLWWGSCVAYRLSKKWLKPQKYPQIFGYCSVWPPTKYVQLFSSSLQRWGLHRYFLCRRFVFNVFGRYVFKVYEWKQLVFLAYLKNRISPKSTSQWRHRWAGPISKVALLSYGSANVFTDFLAQSVREFDRS